MTRIAVNPHLLSWARERAGISAESLANRFPKLAAWEAGELQPTLKQLESFAKAVHVPIGYLFLREPPDEPVPIPDFRTMGDTMPARPSPELLDTIYLCQQRQDWYRDFARQTGEPPLSFMGTLRVGDDIARSATLMREALGFDLEVRRQLPTWTDALRQFIDQADALGVLIMVSSVVGSNNHRKLDPAEFRGFTLADPLAPLVFINGADTKAAQMFTRVNTRENVRLTFDQKVEHVIQEIVDSNFELYKRITDDRAFGEAFKNFLFDQYLRTHRHAEELIKRGESKTLEFKSTLRWNLKEDRQDDRGVTHAVLKTIAAFLNTEGGDLLIGVADDRSIVGIEADRLESDDKFMRHLAQIVRNGLGDRAGTCIDPKCQVVQGKTVCVVSCQRSPEPAFLKWKGLESSPEGDFYVRSGPGTVKLSPDSAQEYIRTRFAQREAERRSN